MTFLPNEGESAGLAMVRAMNYQLHFERTCRDGKQLLQLVLTTGDFNTLPFIPGFKCDNKAQILAEVPYEGSDIVLRCSMNQLAFTFSYGTSKDDLKVLAVVDGHVICPRVLGCMTGNIIGVYATGNGKDSSNQASFDWFDFA